MRILAIGECMAEMAPTDAPSTYQMGFAGDTFNTAWYLAQLTPETPLSYFTAVGDDAISSRMLSVMRESGVNTQKVRIVPNRSVGLYLITLNNGERSFTYWRGQSAARLLAQDKQALAHAMTQSDLIYFSGITLAILNPEGRAALLDVARSARRAGKRIAFDPNLRPHLWDSPSEMTENIMQAAAVSDIALPSFEDEAHWFSDMNPAATLQRYARAGAETIVVKNGAETVIFRTRGAEGSVHVPPLASVVDTTAAGDSFNAGILAGLATEKSLPDSIALACKLAGHVVQGKGALVPVNQSLLDSCQQP
ncbi:MULTISPECIES: sugar kinase [unclassified Ruegeria]|uniref:sugar kinase n=1 Tax=unclassified Ruegeria TaxID=2625375 RepID=UPI0014884DAC|nr:MULTISPECIES: sugar kinase [unclassified Ruegeria]NOD61742.1 sugar kinase [Ruegeria sp. HKCCD6109]